MKEYLIESGKFSEYLITKRLNHKMGLDVTASENYTNLSDEELAECIRIEYNNHRRKQNGFDYISEMAFIKTTFKAEYKMYFLTLTFNNDAFNVSENTRHDAVKRFLSKNTFMYMANIDFGDLNEREHYHAIVLTKERPTGWKMGFMNAQEINFDKSNYWEDLKRIKNYIFKLNNHTFKVSTKLRKIMKDRNNNFLPKYALKTMYNKELAMFKTILKAY